MILNLVSGPRNISTALMYSFAQRSDTRVSDEPFYAVYLYRTGVRHPGREAVLRALPTDETKVRAKLLTDDDRRVLFIKNMAHHMEVLDQPVIAGAKNIFLIRDPRLILASYTAVIDQPVMRDIGIAYQHKLFRALKAAGEEPVVVDSGFLVQDPVHVLTQVCDRCGLPFEQRMAHWPVGPKPYDGVWAPHWYARVHRTTGFENPTARTPALPSHLDDLFEEAQSLYEKLLAFSIKA